MCHCSNVSNSLPLSATSPGWTMPNFATRVPMSVWMSNSCYAINRERLATWRTSCWSLRWQVRWRKRWPTIDSMAACHWHWPSCAERWCDNTAWGSWAARPDWPNGWSSWGTSRSCTWSGLPTNIDRLIATTPAWTTRRRTTSQRHPWRRHPSGAAGTRCARCDALFRGPCASLGCWVAQPWSARRRCPRWSACGVRGHIAIQELHQHVERVERGVAIKLWDGNEVKI